MVDYSSLENCRTERYRGFESLSLRNKGCKSADYAIYTLYYTQIFYCKVLLSGKSLDTANLSL